MLSLSSSQCLCLACNVWLWYFLIILTYFCCFWLSFTPGKQIGKPDRESHAFGIKPVLGIDDAIAKFVFDKCDEKMDMYISLIILA